MYIKLVNGEPTPYSIEQLRQDNKGTSFPKELPDELLANFDVYPVADITPPVVSKFEVVEDAGYLQLADNTWKKAWRVRPATQEEVAKLNLEVDEKRRKVYESEADPVFFKWQRGETTKEEWLAKVEDIKLRYPKG